MPPGVTTDSLTVERPAADPNASVPPRRQFADELHLRRQLERQLETEADHRVVVNHENLDLLHFFRRKVRAFFTPAGSSMPFASVEKAAQSWSARAPLQNFCPSVCKAG